MKTEATTVIKRRIDDVFEFTNTRVAQWSKIVIASETLNETPEGVGSTFRVITEDRGRRMEFYGMTTEWDPPKLSTVVLKGPMFDIEARYTFDDLRDRTRVTQVSRVTGKGVSRILLPIMGLLMRKKSLHAAQDDLANLKKLLEAR